MNETAVEKTTEGIKLCRDFKTLIHVIEYQKTRPTLILRHVSYFTDEPIQFSEA